MCAIACALLLTQVTVATQAPGPVLTVTLLGTGSPEPSMERFGASTLIQAGDQVLLFDVGRGAHQRLAQLGLGVDRLDAIFLTHFHSDHTVGLPDLWLTGWLRTRLSRPVQLLGPPGTTRMGERLVEAFELDIRDRLATEPDLPKAGATIQGKDIDGGVVFEKNGVRVHAVRVEHTGASPALAYRITFGGRSVVLSGDTRFSPELIKTAEGADVIVHEVWDASDAYLANNARSRLVKTFHVSGIEAGEVFQRVCPKLAVYSHIVLRDLTVSDLVTRTRMNYRGPLVVGEDLMQFIIGEQVSILRR
jgi:ribonuclease Z